MAVSLCTGMNKPRKMDPDLLSPVIHRYIAFVDEKELVNVKLMQGHKVCKYENENFLRKCACNS